MPPSPRRGALEQVEIIRLPRMVVLDTVVALRRFGAQRCEGLVLWVGRLDGREAAVERALVPRQNSIRSEEGVGYFIDTEVLFELNQYLSAEGLRLLAQVHSHPTEAYHSATDDAYAIVTTEGGYSLVVPDFARGRPVLADWATYRLCDGRWTELVRREVERTFVLE